MLCVSLRTQVGNNHPMTINGRSPRSGSVSMMSEVTVEGVAGVEGAADVVDVIVPLNPRYAATLRTVTASFGVDAGFSIDEIDDCKLALTEAFSMLVASHPDERARVSFAVTNPVLSLQLSLESTSDISIEPDELALAILRSVVDSHAFTDSAITLQKRATELSGRSEANQS